MDPITKPVSNHVNSLSLFVGTGKCNAHCAHCPAIPIRKYAPKEDGIIDDELIDKTIRDCYGRGARYLSLSSSGEPTLSPQAVTKVLNMLHTHEKEGIRFSPINLYSNGIRIGEEESFCQEYLPLWKSYGLTTLYVTVHNIVEKENARIYRVKSYPPLTTIITRIHQADLLMRANLILSRRTIDSFEKFVLTVEHLLGLGVNFVSAWPIRDMNDQVDKQLSTLEEELDKIERWTESDPRVRLLREKSRAAYHSGQKLTLFPNGTLSGSWCNY